jgi:hypothetical protein
MKRLLPIIFCISFITGCDLFESSNHKNIPVQATFHLQKNQFKKGEDIEATFINKSSDLVYRVRPACYYSWLETKTDDNWIRLYYPHEGLECTADVRFYPLDVGEAIQISISFENLELMVENIEGTYRFSEILSPRNMYQKTEHTIVTSEVFTIK